MTHRFFKASSEVYDAMRSQIDAAWGYPTIHTQTCIPSAADQHKATDGDCVLGVKAEWCEWEPVATLLPQMLSSSQIEEISESEYWAEMPTPDLP